MEDLVGKKLLVLGGTRISCEIIKEAREMGIVVAVTDYNKPEDSPGKQIADESYMVSTTDVDAVVDLIKSKKMDGVLVGFSDMLLPYYADICEKAGLPCYGTRKQFEIFTDKEKYKKICRDYSVPTIQAYSTSILTEEQDINVCYPVIVKPSSGSGSRGITICHCFDELAPAYEKAVKASLNGDVVIEQFLDQEEATVFWIFVNGEYYVSMVGNRHMKHRKSGILPSLAGYTFPSALTMRYLTETAPKVKDMFRSLDILNGMMFMQCKVQDGKCYIYDIGYRLTGSLEYRILKETCGYDPLEMLIRYALTGRMSEDDVKGKINPYLGKYAYNISRMCEPGEIAEIVGVEEVKKYPGVLDVVIAHLPGETITREMEGLLAQVTVRILGTADTEEKLCRAIQEIQTKIKILSDVGEDLSLSGIVSSDIKGKMANINTQSKH